MSSLLPELKEVVHALDPIADKYFEVGVQLGLKPELIRRIEGEHTSHTRRFCETIHSWQRNNSSERCTWSTLAEAVARVGGHDNLVRELEKRGNNAPVSRQSCGESEDSAKDTGYSTKSDWTTSSGSETATEKSFTVAKIEGLDGGDQRGNNTPPLPSESGAEDTGYSTKSDSPISYTESSSGSETERFELVPGCGCKEKPCSVYTLCARGCPKPTRRRIPVLQKKRVGVVSQDDLPFEDEDDCEDFERETKKIQKYFGKFIKDTCCSFKERNVDIEMLTLYLQSSFPVMKPRSKELDEATSMEQVFKIVVDQACSWFNYEVIVSIIEVFGVSSDKDRAQMYEEEFKKYAEQRLPKGKKHIEIGSGAKVGTKQLVVKIDKEWDKVNSNELDKLRGSFASILGVHRSDLYLADVREGCIMMTFMIQEELAKKLFPKKSCLTAEQIHLLKSESVISVRCGNLSWRASAMASNKTESTAVPMEPQTRGASTTANDISDAVTDIEALTPFPLVADEMHPPILYRTPSGGAPSRSQTLGHGSYGVVYKAKCDQLRCAAKVLHPTIVDPSNHDPGVVRIIDGFSQECALLESIRHPNIVKLREPPSSPHNIIHRDLSSNNVLIIAGRRAKVTDFGMSKLAGAAPTMTPLTMYPGTLAYMPPEALREPPRYTKKLDCFSEGVILIQVFTRRWPEPGPRTQLVPFPASPTGMTEIPVLEPERRKNHIDLIHPTNALLAIVEERERPSYICTSITHISSVMNPYLGTDGWFLLRPSSTSEGQLTLAVSHSGRILNFKINSDGRQFYIAPKKRFNNVLALLDFYKTSPIKSKKYQRQKIFLLNPIPVDKS